MAYIPYRTREDFINICKGIEEVKSGRINETDNKKATHNKR